MSIYTASKLSNGMNVITYNMPGAKTVAVNVIAGVGSKFESPELNGISHFLEHMAFKGTKTRSARDIAEEFDKIGGQFNAYTSKELTVYYARTLAEDKEIAVDILSDILQNSLYTAEDIEKEYHVICQEIAQTQDSPDDLAAEQLYKAAYGDSSLGRSILGTPESISKFDSTAFTDFVQTHYTTNNLYIAASGKIDHNEFCNLAEKYFNNITPGNNKNQITEQVIYQPSALSISKELEQSVIMLGFNSVSYSELDQYYHAQLLSLILGGGISSRLFQKIREEMGLAYAVGSFNNSYSNNGLFCLYAATGHDKIHQVTDEFTNAIATITEHLTDEELSRAKSQIRVNVIMSEENVSYKAEEIARQKMIYDRHIPHEEILDKLAQITKNDIMQIAQQIFSSKPVLSIVSNNTANTNYDEIYNKLLK